jgi:hypothetical protein
MINNADFQNYFVLRMTEMMHKDTLDSYRVRTNNALSIIIELRNVLRGWLSGNVKHFSTVDYCIQECISLIKNDDCLFFSNYNKDLFLNDIKDYTTKSKSGKDLPLSHETNSIIYTVEDLIQANEALYFEKLVNKIKSYVFTKVEYKNDQFSVILRPFDDILAAFGGELLRKGYSKKYLFSFFTAMKENPQHKDFKEAFNEMVADLTVQAVRQFFVVIKLSFDNNYNADLAEQKINNIYKSVPQNIQEQIVVQNSYKRTNSQTRYFVIDAKAHDSASAARIGYEELSEMLDYNQDVVKSVKIPSRALVIAQDPNIERKESTENFCILDAGGKYTDEPDESLQSTLKEIQDFRLVQEDVRDRIQSALRHLRIGDSQIEIEQQFINYWIALEFIFSSSDRNFSTFERIKTYLVQILSVCYIKRNTEYLKNWFVKTHYMNQKDNIYEALNDDEAVNGMHNILERFRAKNMKSHLHSRDNIKNYIKAHKDHLLQHIVRIYRLRNELVHEAAIKQDIMNVTSNLRFYLTFVLNQLIGFSVEESSKINEVSMERFFWFYAKWEKLIMSEDAKEGALQVPIAKNYVQ